ncbi:MAG: hypothetical protein K6B41_05290 [Butyrivibrio sp.]|nr:hypothetical protein [Butyrivibrio sp.]
MKKILLSIFAIILGTCFVIGLDALVKLSRQENIEPEDEVIDTYNNYGLLYGMKPSNNILYSNNELVCYEDRVVTFFDDKDISYSHISNLCRRLKKATDNKAEVYFVPMPKRVIYEAGYEEDKEKYDNYINKVNSTAGKHVNVIDLREQYDKLTDEFVFYRTEDTITAYGGVCAGQYIAEKIGMEPHNTDDYEVTLFNKYVGDCISLLGEYYDEKKISDSVYLSARNIDEDPMYIYKYKGNEYSERLSEKDGYYERPAVLSSSPGKVAFVGGNFYHAVITGNSKAQKDGVLIICDSSGKMIAPYLADYYKKVYVSNIARDDDLTVSSLQKIIRVYGIEEIIWAQEAGNAGSEAYTNSLNYIGGAL